jgi:hypothetical protein
MATSDEVAAWLDLAEYARQLSDKMSDIVQRRRCSDWRTFARLWHFVILIILPIVSK